MNWLILLYFLELGYSPFYGSLNVLPTERNYTINNSVYYVHFETEAVLFKHIFIGGKF